MRVRMMVAAVALGACSVMAGAQMNMGKMDSGMKMASGQMAPSKALDDMLSMFEHEMMGVANKMPADKFNFAPSAAIFAPGQAPKFDTVRTFAEQAKHVAEANYYFYAAVSGLTPDMDSKKIEAMTSKEDIVSALAGSFAFAHKAIATITPENAFATIKGADGMHTRVTLAAFAVAHGNDHYGQMVEYLRMNGLTPGGI
ncbi:MAG: DinB family protein [Acidobacteria bacterium]|nr:DinB family protein [Acidobacteriota bacterium]